MENIINQIFGKLKVKQIDINKKYHYICDCSCGKKNLIKNGYKLISGHTKSCGCILATLKETKIGDIFGNWKLIGLVKNTKSKFICECQCDNKTIKEIPKYQLLSNHTRSCGCITQQLIVDKITKHGYAKKKNVKSEYSIYYSMKNRCYSKNNKQYKNYGGRGIKVCDRWLESFENFIKDMGDRPSNKHSIDRIDNNGNYCKENCRWTTKKEQANNNRRNLIITINGKTQNISQWCEELNLSRDSIYARLKRKTPLQKLFNPIRQRKTR